MQGDPHAAAIQCRSGEASCFEPALTIGKQEDGVAMHLPETTQEPQRHLRQRHQSIFIAFGIADMDPLALRIDIAHLQPQAFTESQTQAVDSEIEEPGS